MVPDNIKEPKYKILKEDIILDKLYYKVGDSIYGKIDFIMENNNFPPKKILVYGNGYFRTKLEK